MSLVVISQELSKQNIFYIDGEVLDFSDTEKCINFLNQNKKEIISVYDITKTITLPHKSSIPVNDHINCTGMNPLVGRQKQLNIDFIDMSCIYKQRNNGVVSHSCGQFLDFQYNFPTHFLAHLVILARTLHAPLIEGYLINNIS